jgi:hypothetical protein
MILKKIHIGNLLMERVMFSQLKPGKYYIEYKHGGLLYEYVDFFVGYDGYEAIFDDIVCLCYEDWRYYKMVSRKEERQRNMERRAFQMVMNIMGISGGNYL